MLKITKWELENSYHAYCNGDLDARDLVDAVGRYLFGRTITQEREASIREAVARYHKERGCCDGTDISACTFQEKRVEKLVKEKMQKADFKLPVER